MESFSSFTTELALKFEQQWVDGLVSFSQYLNEIVGLPSVIPRKERIRCPIFTTTSSPAYAMDVIFRICWVIKIDHVFHIINVYRNPTRWQQEINEETVERKTQITEKEENKISV